MPKMELDEIVAGDEQPLPNRNGSIGLPSILSGISNLLSSTWADLENAYAKHLPGINHYTKRAYETVLVPALALACLPVLAISAAGIKATEGADAPVFHRKRIHTTDGTEQYQLKFRSMKVGANDQYHEMVQQGVLNPGGKKSEYDPRVTFFGRLLRKTSCDEVPQIYQLFKHMFTDGFFYKPGKHYHYFVGPRPQSEESIANAPVESREALSRGDTGITGLEQVNRKKPADIYVSEGYQTARYHAIKDNGLVLWTDLKILARTPIAVLGGHNT
jgi:lipopolysaccharide/colanic/teichoic acid biosynthesis glycosyltransferase